MSEGYPLVDPGAAERRREDVVAARSTLTPTEADSVAHILAIVAALPGSGHAVTFAVGDIDDARRYLRRRGLGW